MSAITIEELGREATMVRDGGRTARRKYRIINAEAEGDATEALYQHLCNEFGADPPDSGLLSWWDIDVKEDQKGKWIGLATWQRYQSPNGETQFNFEISVESTRVLVPAGGVTTYAAFGQPAISVQLLGDRCDGREPEGAEISIPTYRESETHWRGASAIDELKAAAKVLVGRVNNAPWKGHAAGEALLLGVSGSRSGLGDWQVTVQWAVRPNQTGLTIGSIAGINKGGWDYLWPISVAAGEMGRRIVTHVAVAPVYYPGNFSLLGIG